MLSATLALLSSPLALMVVLPLVAALVVAVLQRYWLRGVGPVAGLALLANLGLAGRLFVEAGGVAPRSLSLTLAAPARGVVVAFATDGLATLVLVVVALIAVVALTLRPRE